MARLRLSNARSRKRFNAKSAPIGERLWRLKSQISNSKFEFLSGALYANSGLGSQSFGSECDKDQHRREGWRYKEGTGKASCHTGYVAVKTATAMTTMGGFQSSEDDAGCVAAAGLGAP